MAWLSFKRILYPLLISVAVAAATALVALTVSYLLFPVTGVEVTGARMFPEAEAWEAVPDHASLPFLNAESVERRIESNPWVQSAEVIEKPESGIVTVEVEEREAVVDGELDGRRVVLAADGTELPGLGGARLERVELDETRLEEVLGFIGAMEGAGLLLESVDATGAGGVEATVDGRRVLFAGGVEASQVRALEGLVEEHPDAAYFDLRSPGRVVVGQES